MSSTWFWVPFSTASDNSSRSRGKSLPEAATHLPNWSSWESRGWQSPYGNGTERAVGQSATAVLSGTHGRTGPGAICVHSEQGAMGPPNPPTASPSLCPTPSHSDQASPSCSCCPIVCRHGERHRLPHHAGERPGAGGRGGGLSPAVGGAQPDLDLLLGVSEGRHPSPWHRGEEQPGTAPISSPLWRSPSPRMNKEESLLLPRLLPHPSSLPSQGGCNHHPAQKQPPPCLPLCSPADSQALTDPSCGRAGLPGLQPCSHPSRLLSDSRPSRLLRSFSSGCLEKSHLRHTCLAAGWETAVPQSLRTFAGTPAATLPDGAGNRERPCWGGGDGSTRCASLWQRWWGRRGTGQPCCWSQ